jgi:hypothetical protein
MVGNIACCMKKKLMQSYYYENLKGVDYFLRLSHTWEVYTEPDLTETECEHVHWVQLAQDSI